MSAATRRAALGAILAAPLASVPAVAAPSTCPDLGRLVEQCEAADAAMHGPALDADCGSYWKRLRQASAEARAAVALAPCRSMADLALKLRCLRSIEFGADVIREEVELACEHWCYGDDLMKAVVADLMDLEEAGLCV